MKLNTKIQTYDIQVDTTGEFSFPVDLSMDSLYGFGFHWIDEKPSTSVVFGLAIDNLPVVAGENIEVDMALHSEYYPLSSSYWQIDVKQVGNKVVKGYVKGDLSEPLIIRLYLFGYARQKN